MFPHILNDLTWWASKLFHLFNPSFLIPSLDSYEFIQDTSNDVVAPHLIFQVLGTLGQQWEEYIVLVFVPEEIVADYDIGVFFISIVFEAVYYFLRELLILMIWFFWVDLFIDLLEDTEFALDELFPSESEDGLKRFFADILADLVPFVLKHW